MHQERKNDEVKDAFDLRRLKTTQKKKMGRAEALSNRRSYGRHCLVKNALLVRTVVL